MTETDDHAAPAPLAGVIGHPIAHSKSPALHRHWLDTYGLPGDYIAMDVRDADLEDVLRTLPKAGFVGVNITIPHKVKVLEIDRQGRIRLSMKDAEEEVA